MQLPTEYNGQLVDPRHSSIIIYSKFDKNDIVVKNGAIFHLYCRELSQEKSYFTYKQALRVVSCSNLDCHRLSEVKEVLIW